MTSSINVSAAQTSFRFYTIEMECLIERLKDLQEEVQEARYSAFFVFQSKLSAVSKYFLDMINPLVEQFSIMKNMDKATLERGKIFMNALGEYNNIHAVTCTLIQTKCANLLVQHARAGYLKLLKKTDVELFSEGDTISIVFSAFQNEINVMQEFITEKNNFEAYGQLKAAKKIFHIAKRDTTARREEYFKSLQEKLRSPCSISLSMTRRPVVYITISLEAGKKNQDGKLMIK